MKKTPLIVLTMTLGLLCSCVTTPKGTRPPESDPISSDGSTRVEYPAVIRGAWRLGPEPCHLPVNPDADGRLEISAAEMIGYETTYKPVRIESANKTANTWVIKSIENYLGSQVTEEVQTFSLVGTTLIVKGQGYEEAYVKCARVAERGEYPLALRGRHGHAASGLLPVTDRDCFSFGKASDREACFALKSDDAIHTVRESPPVRMRPL